MGSANCANDANACKNTLICTTQQQNLALKRPKSGVYVNETERPNFSPSDDIPYSTYNPRVLQEQFDAQNLKKIDLIPSKATDDMWTWNVGLQKKESDLDRVFLEASVPKFECNNLELRAYTMPKDVHKTFSADIILGTKAVQPQAISKRRNYYRRPIEMACLYIGFVEGFRLNADFWTAETMDNIIKMAEKLIEKCVKINYKSQDNDYDIIPQIDERQAAFNIKVHFSGPLKSEPNIYKALTIFFSKYNVCILCSNKLFLLIWKRCKNFFYVYDPNGRAVDCTRDFEKGKSALLTTHFVEHLVHFIVNISQTNLDDEFKLYEIFLTSYGKIPDPLPNEPFPKPYHKQWAVVNESYAVIPGCNNGLFQPTTSAVDNPSMLISVMAILYAHIERGNSWKPGQVDELIRLGTAYYKSLRRKLRLKDAQHVTIVDLPDKYVLGTFKASLKKVPFMYTGTVTDLCKKFMDSLLTCGMQELFNSKWEAALLQIDNSVLGIWRDDELFYVYDPFRRGKAGQVLDPDDYRTQGAAMLQMHTNTESLLRILYEKSLKMRRGGKFFIHAINVGCIKPIMDGKPRKLRYPKLKLTPETYVQRAEQGQGDVTKDAQQKKSANRDKESKSKKAKNKDKKTQLDMVCSIETLEEKEYQIVIKTFEIVEPLLDEIVCEIVDKFPESLIGRPKLYKSAARVLLQSDKEYLENLKYLVKHDEDNDNMEMSVRTEPEPIEPVITLKDELKLPSNFQTLPDGSWIIFSSQHVYCADEEQYKLTGLLSSIVSAALTAKYKISTWTTKVIDYALVSVENFVEDFKTYQYALGALLHKSIPKLLLGDRTFQLSVQKILSSDAKVTLSQTLADTFKNFNRLLVICQRFSCLIIKRYNFLYMFCGFPVNAVGYRQPTTGPICLMRFVDLDSALRRIEFSCNPQGCDILNYVVIPIKVTDLTSEPQGHYRTWPRNLEKPMLDTALEEKSRLEESKKSKMRFLNEELTRENLRMKYFWKKRVTRNRNKIRKIMSSEEAAKGEFISEAIEYEDEEFLNEEDVEEECTVEAKHDFDSELDLIKVDEYPKPRPVLYGYRLREKDLLYKIQGSKALTGREICTYEEIKPCLFASALAILYAILKPLNKWSSHRIDQVIDSTLVLSDTIEDLANAKDRNLKNLSVDDYIFDILLRVYEPLGNIGNLENQFERVLSQKKYIILQTANCSYAVSRDKFYHLFDPYPSMALMDDDDEDLEEEENTDDLKRQRKYPKTIKRYGERNTASWVLFADITSMVKYMNQRACSKTWKENRQYKFIVMEATSFKKAPQSTFMLQLLTGMQTCNVYDDQDTSVCAHNESVAWLEHCLPIWSRLNRRNAAGRYRGMVVTKLKEFDIEIEHRLWSLWGNLHPQAPVFETSTRGKQYLPCCVISLCAAYLYRLIDWSPQLLDSIIVNGDCYLKQSIQTIRCEDYEFALEDLDTECMLDSVKFAVHIEMVAIGMLYTRVHSNSMNLAKALTYFFEYFQFGILQSFKKCLAIGFMPGRDGGYFMFDCQSRDNPLFPKGQGSSYVLRTKYLQILLYCIVVTLNIPYYNVSFTLHKLNFKVKDQEGDEEE